MLGLLLAPGQGGIGVVTDARHQKNGPDDRKTRVINVIHCKKFLRGFRFNLVGNRVCGLMRVLKYLMSSPTFILLILQLFRVISKFIRSLSGKWAG